MVAMEPLVSVQAHRAQGTADGPASGSEDGACHEHSNVSEEAFREKSGAKGSESRIMVVVGRVGILRSPL
jgi:hypothetical protein